ncbi:hypothetical protein SDC9_73758 [bioreactor metagenome]|uniref:Uncharacterized protein n=1 Tax=bioreactor metagenome TaxID=1076179 RepID=A0A644YGX9_9ZZZZ
MGTKRYTPSNLKFASLSLSGLEEYLSKVQAAGNNVEAATEKAIEESVKPIRDDIRAWAEKHKRTGAVLAGVDESPVQRDGNYIFANAGISTETEEQAWRAVFVEYGTPRAPADPGIRTAFDRNTTNVKKIQKEVLQREGVPID